MAMNRILVLGSDAAYYDYTVIAIASFLKHNPNWDVLVMDVGMTPAQARSLESVAQVIPYPRDEVKGGKSLYYASAMARCLALARYPSATRLMLYLDGDTVTLGSIEPLVEQFLGSGRSLGLAAENDPRFYQYPVSSGWEGGVIPEEWVHRDRWAHLPIINDGILLAFGPAAATIGHQCVQFYEAFKTRCRYEQQTILNAILYENQIDWFPLPAKYHCFLKDNYLQKSGRPYIDPVCLDGEEIVIRHFPHEDNKAILNALKAFLLNHYFLPRGEELPTVDPSEGPNKATPSVAEGLAHAGKLFSHGQLDELDNLCHLVLTIAPDTAEAYRYLGLAAYARGRFKEAKDHFQRALTLAPLEAAAHDNLSLVLMALGRPGEAETAARRALALNPRLANAAHNLGLALKRQGRFAEAEFPLRQSLALEPNNPSVWNNLGTNLAKLERFSEAIDCLERALQLYPEFKLAKANLQQIRSPQPAHAL